MTFWDALFVISFNPINRTCFLHFPHSLTLVYLILAQYIKAVVIHSSQHCILSEVHNTSHVSRRLYASIRPKSIP